MHHLAPGLSHAELGPSDGEALPFGHAGEVTKSGAIIANFADGESQGVTPDDGEKIPPEMRRSADAAKRAAEDALLQQTKLQKADDPSTAKGPWKEVWEKNMDRWRGGLEAMPAKPVISSPGLLDNGSS